MQTIKKTLSIICLLILTNSLSAQSYKLPNYTTYKLPNGLTVNLMEQHDVPIIDVSVILPAGAIYDYDKAGLASLTAVALKHGTKNFTKSQLDEELDFIGANVDTYASKEFAGLSANFAAKDKIRVLGIIKEILLNPVFVPFSVHVTDGRRLPVIGLRAYSRQSKMQMRVATAPLLVLDARIARWVDEPANYFSRLDVCIYES